MNETRQSLLLRAQTGEESAWKDTTRSLPFLLAEQHGRTFTARFAPFPTRVEVLSRFRTAYHAMLRAVLATGKPAAVCTIYDSIPGFNEVEMGALGAFNEVILRAGFQAGLPVLDLRLLCDQAVDYSPVSPIEPSVVGGGKIARLIARVATEHDFSRRQSVVFS